MGVSTFWRFFARPQRASRFRPCFKLTNFGIWPGFKLTNFQRICTQAKTHRFLRSLKKPRVGFGEDVSTWVPRYVTFREGTVLGAWPSVALTFWCSFGVVKHRFYVEWNLVKLAKEFEDLPRICRPTSDKFLFLRFIFSIVFSKRKIPHFVFQSLYSIQSINFFPAAFSTNSWNLPHLSEVLILDALLLMYEHRGYIWNGPHGALQLVTAATRLNEEVSCYTTGRGHSLIHCGENQTIQTYINVYGNYKGYRLIMMHCLVR